MANILIVGGNEAMCILSADIVQEYTSHSPAVHHNTVAGLKYLVQCRIALVIIAGTNSLQWHNLQTFLAGLNLNKSTAPVIICSAIVSELKELLKKNIYGFEIHF